MEAEFVTEGDQTRLRLRSVESDGTPRNFYDTVAAHHRPGLDADRGARSTRSRRASTRHRSRASLTPGAYALRFDQTQAGRDAARADGDARRADARRVPAAGHQRAAAGGAARRDRRRAPSTDGAGRLDARPRYDHCRHATCWPWLLLLALLLWPLDVAVRRVSVARCDLALARAWSGARWRAWRGPARAAPGRWARCWRPHAEPAAPRRGRRLLTPTPPPEPTQATEPGQRLRRRLPRHLPFRLPLPTPAATLLPSPSRPTPRPPSGGKAPRPRQSLSCARLLARSASSQRHRAMVRSGSAATRMRSQSRATQR